MKPRGWQKNGNFFEPRGWQKNGNIFLKPRGWQKNGIFLKVPGLAKKWNFFESFGVGKKMEIHFFETPGFQKK